MGLAAGSKAESSRRKQVDDMVDDLVTEYGQTDYNVRGQSDVTSALIHSVVEEVRNGESQPRNPKP